MTGEESMDPFQGFTAFYVSHKEAPLEAIGRLAMLKESIYQLRGLVNGIIVVSTCNRFEVYVEGGRPEAFSAIESAFASQGLKPKMAVGREAAARLLRIAAGLESRIIGEPEILGQVRNEWREARVRGYTSPLLDSILHEAIVTGKKVRSLTGIGRGHASYPSAAVHFAASRLGTLNGKSIAVVGAGEAGLGVLRVLCSEYAPRMVTVYTRDPDRARASVGEACPGAIVKGRWELEGGYDAALIAVEDPRGLEIDGRLASFIVDLSVPRIAFGPNAYGLEDLEKVVEKVIEERRRWVAEAERLIQEDLERLEERLRARNVSILLRVLMEYADSLARSESSKGDGCMGSYDLLFSYSRKLLHPLIVSLRETASKAWRLEEFLAILEENYSVRLRGES